MLQQHPIPPNRPFPLRALTLGRRNAGRLSPRAKPAERPTGVARRTIKADSREFAAWWLRKRGKRLIVTAPKERPWDWQLVTAPLRSHSDDAWKLHARSLRASGYTFDAIAETLSRSASTVRIHARVSLQVCACTLRAACTIHGGNIPALTREAASIRDKAPKLSGAARNYDQDNRAGKSESWLRKNDPEYLKYSAERHVSSDDMLARTYDKTNATHDSLAGIRDLSEDEHDSSSDEEDVSDEHEAAYEPEQAPALPGDGHYRRGAHIDDDWQPMQRRTLGLWCWRPDEATTKAIDAGNKKWLAATKKHSAHLHTHARAQCWDAACKTFDVPPSAQDRAAVRWAIANIKRRSEAIRQGLELGSINLRIGQLQTLAGRQRQRQQNNLPPDYTGESWYWPSLTGAVAPIAPYG